MLIFSITHLKKHFCFIGNLLTPIEIKWPVLQWHQCFNILISFYRCFMCLKDRVNRSYTAYQESILWRFQNDVRRLVPDSKSVGCSPSNVWCSPTSIKCSPSSVGCSPPGVMSSLPCVGFSPPSVLCSPPCVGFSTESSLFPPSEECSPSSVWCSQLVQGARHKVQAVPHQVQGVPTKCKEGAG